MTLIDSDHLFQTLLTNLGIADVAADLDVDSIEHVPLITHTSTIQQNANGPGLWTCTLIVTVFLDTAETPFAVIQTLYDAIHQWPVFAVVPGVAGVETVEDVEAFARQGKGAPMLNKIVTPFVGVFTLTIRNH